MELHSNKWRNIWSYIPINGVNFGIKLPKRMNLPKKALTGLNTILDKPLLHSFIISNDPETHHISDNITAVHAAMFLG